MNSFIYINEQNQRQLLIKQGIFRILALTFKQGIGITNSEILKNWKIIS